MNPSTTDSRTSRAPSSRRRESGISSRPGDPAQERRRRRVGELVREALAEDQTDGARTAGPQPARRRIGPGVAELLGGREHALPHGVGDELGAPERLGRAPDGDARALRDVSQPDAPLRHRREY
jgi:hypothetical protein